MPSWPSSPASCRRPGSWPGPGAATPTFLTFEAPTLAVELEVLDTGTGRRLLGQLVPPVAGQVEVRHGGGVTAAAADEMGRFSVTAVTAGPVSLRCVAGDTVIETDWFLA